MQVLAQLLDRPAAAALTANLTWDLSPGAGQHLVQQTLWALQVAVFSKLLVTPTLSCTQIVLDTKPSPWLIAYTLRLLAALRWVNPSDWSHTRKMCAVFCYYQRMVYSYKPQYGYRPWSLAHPSYVDRRVAGCSSRSVGFTHASHGIDQDFVLQERGAVLGTHPISDILASRLVDVLPSRRPQDSVKEPPPFAIERGFAEV